MPRTEPRDRIGIRAMREMAAKANIAAGIHPDQVSRAYAVGAADALSWAATGSLPTALAAMRIYVDAPPDTVPLFAVPNGEGVRGVAPEDMTE